MKPAHKRAVDSFVSHRSSLDLPIPIGLDIDLDPLVSLKVGVGGIGGEAATTTPPDGHTTTAIDTTSAGVTSQSSSISATSVTSAHGDGEHSGGGPTPTPINPINIVSSSSITEDLSSDASFTHGAQATQRSKQGVITSGDQDGAGLLVVVETSPGVTTATSTRITRPSDGVVISSGTPIPFSTTSFSPNVFFSSGTTTFSSASSSSEGPRITDVLPSGTSHQRLSLGAIAGIVIALFILLAGIVIFICRRRRAYRRDQAALGWRTSMSSYQYQDESTSRFHDVFRRFTIAVPQRRPTESFNEDTAILSPPPMLEYARSEKSSRSAASSLPHSLQTHSSNPGHRHSVSVGSTHSTGTARSLLIDIHESPFKDPSPKSAPPFSSSTSFTLSNPPIPTIQISPPPSPKKLFVPSYRPITVDLPPIPPLPSSPPPMPPRNQSRDINPFEDPPG